MANLVVSTTVSAVAPPSSQYPTLDAADWDVVQYGSPNGDTAQFTLTGLPDKILKPVDTQDEEASASGYVVDAIILNVNGVDVTLPYGAVLDHDPSHHNYKTQPKRLFRIPAGANGVTCIPRLVWRDNDNGDTFYSDPAPAKTVDALVAQPSIEIHSTRTTGTAPFGWQGYAIIHNSGDLEPISNHAVLWDYGDPGSVHHILPADYALAHPTNTNNANVGFDQHGAHAYYNSGTFTATASTIINGQTVQASVTITSQNVTTNYDAANTYMLVADAANPPAHMPAGATPVTNLESIPNANTRRVLIDADHFTSLNPYDHAALNGGAVNWSMSPRRLHVQGYGAGGPAHAYTVNTTFVRAYSSSETEASLSKIAIDGGYDPTNPLATTVEPPKGIVIAGNEITIVDCILKGCSKCLDTNNSAFVFVDNHVSDWWDYGIGALDCQKIHAVVGNFIKQNVNTLRDSSTKNDAPYYAQHGPYRCSHPLAPALIATNDVLSNNTWSGDTSVQPCFRWNAGGSNRAVLSMSRNKSEGAALYLGSTSNPTPVCWVAGIVQMHHHICTTKAGFTTAFAGLRHEAIIVVAPDVPLESSTNIEGLLSVSDPYDNPPQKDRYPNYALSQAAPIRMYGNSILILTSLANNNNTTPQAIKTTGQKTGVPAYAFTNADILGNVIHAPGLGQDTVTGLDLVSKFDGAYLGRRVKDENGDAIQTQFATGAIGLLPTPSAGSNVPSSAGNGAIRWYDGTLRNPGENDGALKQAA